MSLDFNGTTSVVVWPVSATLRPVLPLTLAAWVFADTLKVAGIINNNKDSGTHRGAYINVSDTSGHIECAYGDNGGSAAADRRSKITSTGGIASGAWNHVCASLRGATDMTIYVNGVDIGGTYSGSGGGMVYSTSVAGRFGLSNVSFFDGKIADGAMWNVSLATADVLAMSKGVAAKLIRPESLLVNYPMWDALNPTIDLSANSLEASTLTSVSAANHGPVGCPWGVPV